MILLSSHALLVTGHIASSPQLLSADEEAWELFPAVLQFSSTTNMGGQGSPNSSGFLPSPSLPFPSVPFLFMGFALWETAEGTLLGKVLIVLRGLPVGGQALDSVPLHRSGGRACTITKYPNRTCDTAQQEVHFCQSPLGSRCRSPEESWDLEPRGNLRMKREES